MVPGFNPFGLRSAPSDAVHVLRSLPALVERVEQIAKDTAVLTGLKEAVESITGQAGSLTAVQETTARIGEDTSALPRVGERIDHLAGAVEVLATMDERMATIEAAMPVLVEVQQHLARLPDTIETLGGDLNKLSELLAHMLSSLDRLDASVALLHSSVEPLGRIANRLPGRASREQAAARESQATEQSGE